METEKKIKVLMVDDEKDFCSAVAEYLELKNCDVMQTHDINSFRTQLQQSETPDVVLIDKMIAGDDGFDLIHNIRATEDLQTIPILVITACSDIKDRVEALRLGADDLLVKPVAMEELMARIEANMRRARSYLSPEQMITMENLKINLRTHQVFVQEQPIELTTTEYRVFLELILKRGEILPRERLAAKFLTLRNSNPRTLDVHVTSLRKKLGGFSERIKTIRGRGYMFAPTP